MIWFVIFYLSSSMLLLSNESRWQFPCLPKEKKIVNNPAFVKTFRAGLLQLQWIWTWQFDHLCWSHKQSQKTAELLLDVKVNCIVSSPRVPAIDTATAISEVKNFSHFYIGNSRVNENFTRTSILIIWGTLLYWETTAVDSFDQLWDNDKRTLLNISYEDIMSSYYTDMLWPIIVQMILKFDYSVEIVMNFSPVSGALL